MLVFVLVNKLIGYNDDSTFKVVVSFPGVRVTVAEFLMSALGRVSEWCDFWGMKSNSGKTKTMIVSRSSTIHPQSPLLTIGRTCTEGV